MADDYQHLMLTDEFVRSLSAIEPPLSEDDYDGILDVLDALDAEPAVQRNRLHQLDRELTGWWSLTPLEPANPSLRILVKPEVGAAGGYWRVGPVTWHYKA